MRPTRQFTASAAIAVGLAGLAVLIERQELLLGTAVIGGYLIARQIAFLRALERADRGVTIEIDPERQRLVTDEPAAVTVRASLQSPSPLDLTVRFDPPIAASSTSEADRTLHLDSGDVSAQTTLTLSWPVAGEFDFDKPLLEATDNLLTETLRRGPAAKAIVDPRVPRTMHVGEGGDELAAAFGEHSGGRLGTGLEPAELRPYVPGDAADRIDWNATARLRYPHVREFEAETDRETLLVVDCRQSMNTGLPGETEFDYARQVALAFVANARELDDPLGLLTVGDDGILANHSPATAAGTYSAIRETLQSTQATRSSDQQQSERLSPATARQRADRLSSPSPFAATLRPFFAAQDPYLERIAEDPLFGAIRRSKATVQGTIWTALLTDDTDRAGVREAVKLARSGNDSVMVFLTPEVLFEPGGLADLEAAYDRYRDFEEFRRELAQLDRVAAFEVGPRDRLDAVLDTGRRRRPMTQPS